MWSPQRCTPTTRNHPARPTVPSGHSTKSRPCILVTGMADGLGAEIAAVFAGAGFDVVGVARSQRCSTRVHQLIEQAGGSYAHLDCDVTQADEVTAVLGPYAG